MRCMKVVATLLVVAIAGCTNGSDSTVHTSEIARGRSLVVSYGCGSCHQIDGIANAIGKVGPKLNGIGHRTLIAGKLVNTPENMRNWLMDPPSITPGTAMPDLHLDSSNASAIAAYLSTLQ